MGRGSTLAREINFVSLMVYGPKVSHSALAMRELQLLNQAGQFPTIPYIRINSKGIKDLNVSHATIKILKENIGIKISDTLVEIFFADMSLKARKIKKKVNKWYHTN